jgi:hypothetical protein
MWGVRPAAGLTQARTCVVCVVQRHSHAALGRRYVLEHLMQARAAADVNKQVLRRVPDCN